MILLIALLFVVVLVGFVLALLSAPSETRAWDADIRSPRQKRADARRENRLHKAGFVPLEGHEGRSEGFPKGTWTP